MRVARAVATRLAAALVLSPLAPGALYAATMPFVLPVPPDFVSLPPRDEKTLLVAGDFRAGTTLSVQRLDEPTLRRFRAVNAPMCDDVSAPLCEQNAGSIAAALAAYRDTQAAPSGAMSEVVPGSTRLNDGKLTFEMLLVLGGTPGAPPDPELSRRTAVAALPCDGGMSWLCLWAGAKASNWDAGDGALLLRSLDGFALR